MWQRDSQTASKTNRHAPTAKTALTHGIARVKKTVLTVQSVSVGNTTLTLINNGDTFIPTNQWKFIDGLIRNIQWMVLGYLRGQWWRWRVSTWRLSPFPVPDLSITANARLHFQPGSFSVYLQAAIGVGMTQSVVLKNSHNGHFRVRRIKKT